MVGPIHARSGRRQAAAIRRSERPRRGAHPSAARRDPLRHRAQFRRVPRGVPQRRPAAAQPAAARRARWLAATLLPVVRAADQSPPSHVRQSGHGGGGPSGRRRTRAGRPLLRGVVRGGGRRRRAVRAALPHDGHGSRRVAAGEGARAAGDARSRGRSRRPDAGRPRLPCGPGRDRHARRLLSAHGLVHAVAGRQLPARVRVRSVPGIGRVRRVVGADDAGRRRVAGGVHGVRRPAVPHGRRRDRSPESRVQLSIAVVARRQGTRLRRPVLPRVDGRSRWAADVVLRIAGGLRAQRQGQADVRRVRTVAGGRSAAAPRRRSGRAVAHGNRRTGRPAVVAARRHDRSGVRQAAAGHQRLHYRHVGRQLETHTHTRTQFVVSRTFIRTCYSIIPLPIYPQK